MDRNTFWPKDNPLEWELPAVSQIFMVTDMFPDVTVFIKNEAPIVVIEFSTKRPRT